MFDTGSARLKPYTVQILHELGRSIDDVPNQISISGHTDDAPYSSEHNYSNWELSADRGNAARRALIAGGLEADKISRVVGLAASVPFDKQHPADPVNRRISIIVMTDQAAQAARSMEVADGGAAQPSPMPTPTPAPLAAPVVAMTPAPVRLPVPPVIVHPDSAATLGTGATQFSAKPASR
jgi:chemotaxis protein MotB